MLNIALTYSRKWRFKFNAQKSCILKFRARGNRTNQNYEWTLGEDVVPCLDSYNHLGILVNNKCTLVDRITAACRKGRNSYFALADLGSQYLNPLTISHLYKRVVLSSVLYGCELWNDISQKDSQRLNVFQHLVCKNAQGLPKRTRSDICETLFDVLPIQSEIDVRKLLFFGRLCRLDCRTLPKMIFLSRFFSYVEGLARTQMGFIPDIMSLLTTYNLLDDVHSWLTSGSCPTKMSWKRTVRAAVNQLSQSERDLRMAGNSFSRFREVFENRNPRAFWRLPANCYEISLCKLICKIISHSQEADDNPQLCPLCDRYSLTFSITQLALVLRPTMCVMIGGMT